ncbi:MAG: hypothetical protein NTX25_04445 [Proteobacteria bacterium]|nr:hypothetical protein [Pseudomonadota bacterium]
MGFWVFVEYGLKDNAAFQIFCGKVANTGAFNQRRTQILSNSEIIWDMGGNVWQWIDYNNANDKPTPATAAWSEFTAMTGSTTTYSKIFTQLDEAISTDLED